MSNPLNCRRAGVLLHISSLPNSGKSGDLGQEAYNFINFLHDCGITVWQILPLNIPHNNDSGSPYQCLSAHAGNTGFISQQWLTKKYWLQPTKPTENYFLSSAFNAFKINANSKDKDSFYQFCQTQGTWLDDFALFMALRQEFNLACWSDWPESLKNRQPKAIKTATQRFSVIIELIKFNQFIFFQQWSELKAFAKEKNVFLFGDVPIFVSYNSADVWANRKVFKLNANSEMSVVAGTPPDYFSPSGQRWGNPHYDWKYLKGTGFKWWLERMKSQYKLFDILRIDHFRGLESAWEILASEDTAIKGKWVKAPGEALLQAIITMYNPIALVAEDLGVITKEVYALRDKFGLAGMKILQFAFDDNVDNIYLPHNHEKNNVVYTGTHDNDTTLGWFNSLNDYTKHRVYEYLGNSVNSMPYALISTALASTANLAIIPMQDVLGLDTKARMNIPGTCTGNWNWQFEWSQLTKEHCSRLAHYVALYGR